MSRNILEEQKITVVALLQKGQSTSASVQFVFRLDGTEVATVDGQIAADPYARMGKAATCVYTAPLVPKDKPSSKLEYHVVADGEEYRNADEIIIWPKRVKIESVEDADPTQALKGLKFNVMQGGARQGATQKTDGEPAVATALLSEGHGFTIEAVPPFEIKSQEEKDGALRDLKVRAVLNITAEFVKPVIPGDKKIRQFVNLDTSGGPTGQDGKGEKVVVRVGAKGDRDASGVTVADPVARAGIFVYVKVEFGGVDGKSQRNLPKTELLAGRNATALVAVDDAKTYTAKIDLALAGGVGEFELCLGLAGGDTCKVSIGGTDACADDAVTFVNWRRLFYELRYPDFMAPELSDGVDASGTTVKDLKASVMGLVKSRLGEGQAFIDFVLLGSASFSEAEGGGAVLDGATVSAAGRKRYCPSGSLRWVEPKAFTTADKRAVKIRLCDRVFKFRDKTAAVLKQMTADTQSWPHSGGYLFEQVFDDDGLFPDAVMDSEPMTWKAVFTVGTADQRAAHMVTPALVAPADHTTVTTAGAQDGVITVKDNLHGQPDLVLDFPNPRIGDRPKTLSNGQRTQIRDFMANIMTIAHMRADPTVDLGIVAQTDNARRRTRADNVIAGLGAAFDTRKTELGPVPNHPGLADDGTPREGTLDRSWIRFTDFKHYEVALPTGDIGGVPNPGELAGPALTPTKCKIEVGFKLRVHGSSNGAAKKNIIVLCYKPAAASECASTACHELTHAMGMTITSNKSKVPPGMPAAKTVDNGGTYYSNKLPASAPGYRNLHNGSHCAHGVPATDLAKSDLGGLRGNCIMFGSGQAGVDDRTSFCPTCRDYLRGRKLVDLVQEWDARGATDY